MGLTKIPTRTDDSLGRVKYDQRPATDLETQIQASEYNATADAVIAVSEAVGLADGSTPGSLEARLADALSRLDDAETCCATNGDRLDVIEPKVATLEADGDKQARQRLDALEPEVQDHEQRIATLDRLLWATVFWDSQNEEVKVEAGAQGLQPAGPVLADGHVVALGVRPVQGQIAQVFLQPMYEQPVYLADQIRVATWGHDPSQHNVILLYEWRLDANGLVRLTDATGLMGFHVLAVAAPAAPATP